MCRQRINRLTNHFHRLLFSIAYHFLSLFSLSLLSPLPQALSCSRPAPLHPQQQLHAAAMSQISPRRTRKQHKVVAMHPRSGGRRPLRHPGWDNRPRSSCLDPHRILRQRHQSPCGASPHPRPRQIGPQPLSLSGGMQRMRTCLSPGRPEEEAKGRHRRRYGCRPSHISSFRHGHAAFAAGPSGSNDGRARGRGKSHRSWLLWSLGPRQVGIIPVCLGVLYGGRHSINIHQISRHSLDVPHVELRFIGRHCGHPSGKRLCWPFDVGLDSRAQASEFCSGQVGCPLLQKPSKEGIPETPLSSRR